MGRLIDADELEMYVYREVALYNNMDEDVIVEAILKQPTVDAAPVAHGRWALSEEECPICGESKFRGLDADIWADWQPAYCPNCGTKMDEVQLK